MFFEIDLQYVDMSHNQFDGDVLLKATQWRELIYLSLEGNAFHGIILHKVYTCNYLNQLRLADNYFHETIPDNFTTNNFYFFDIAVNDFYGTIPKIFCDYPDLQSLDLSKNRLSGTIPFCIGDNQPILEELILYSNDLSGELHSFFAKPNNFTELAVLLIGYNKFEGSFPISVFHYPSLIALSAEVNCFSRILDDSFCKNISTTLSLINLNGLHAGQNCRQRFTILPGYYTSRMKGSIPYCFWDLPNLDTLALAGNGFSGTIPSTIGVARRFPILSLSHNYLSGDIPVVLQEHQFKILDLSFNKLTGNLNEVNNISLSSIQGGSWNISNNRISGNLLSSSFKKAKHVEMLYGNLFACSNNLPENDPNYHNYFCGSSQLDYSTYSFAFIVLVALIPLLGIPSWIRDMVTYILGLCIAFGTYRLHKEPVEYSTFKESQVEKTIGIVSEKQGEERNETKDDFSILNKE